MKANIEKVGGMVQSKNWDKVHKILTISIILLNGLLFVNYSLIYIFRTLGYIDSIYRWMTINYYYIDPYSSFVYIISIIIVLILKVKPKLKYLTVLFIAISYLLTVLFFYKETDIF